MRPSLSTITAAIITSLALVSCSSTTGGEPESDSGATGAKDTDKSTAAVKYYENGDHVVGDDISAGVYRGEVEDSVVALCTMSQSSESGKVMDVRNANDRSVIFTVTNKKGSVVAFSGCANIAKAKDVLRKNAKPGNGWFLVGSELAPGRYSGKVDTDSPIKLGTITQMNAKGSVMDIRNANAGQVVFTVKKSSGSVVSFSGFSSVEKMG